MSPSPRWLFLAALALARSAHGQFIPTGAGPHQYNDSANWDGGTINGFFSQTLTANQTVLVPFNFFAAPTFTFGGTFDLTLRGNLPAPSTLHFTNSPSVDSVAGGRTVNIGSPTAQNQLAVELDSGVNFDVAANDTLVLWNRVGGGVLRKFGVGRMILHGANTYTGGTQIGDGVLEVSADNNLGVFPAVKTDNLLLSGEPFNPAVLRLMASFDLNPNRSIKLFSSRGGAIDTNGFDTTFEGEIGGAIANTIFYKRGAGELRLKGANTYGGTTIIQGGTLTWDYTANNGGKTDALGDVQIVGRTQLSLTGNPSASTVQGIASITIAGSAAIRLTSGTPQSVVLNAGRLQRASGTVDFSLPASGGIHVDTPSFTGVLGYATVDGSDWAMRDMGGFLVRLPSYDVDSLATAANSDLTTNQHVSTSTAIGSLRFNAPSAVSLTLDIAAHLTIGPAGQTGGILVTGNVGTSAVSIAGGQLTVTGRDLVVIQNNVAQPMTISSSIVNSAASIGLTKSGPGVLILEGGNTFTGVTHIADGTLRLSGAGRLPDSGPVDVNELATLDLNGISQTVGRLIGGVGSSITTGGATLSVKFDTLDYQFNGVISGAGGFSKLGLGKQTLGGANTYTGPTVIEAGSILLAGDGSLPETTSLSINGSSFAGLTLGGRPQKIANLMSANPMAHIYGPGILVVGAGNGTYAGVFGLALALVKDGANTTTILTGSSFHTGGTTLKAGTLAITSDSALGSAPLSAVTNVTFEGGLLQLNANISTLDANRHFLINSPQGIIDTNGFSTFVPGSISGPGGLTKIGAGNLSLGGANTFAGGVTVNGGAVSVSDGSLGASGTVVRLNGGALLATGEIPRGIILGTGGGGLGSATTATFSGAVSGDGVLSINAPGAVTLTAQNTYSAGTQIGPAGALLAPNGNRSLGPGPVTVLSGGLLGLSTAANMAPGVLVPLRPGAALAVLNTTIDPAAVIDPDPAKTTGGILALGAATYDRPLDMATIGNGKLFLSAFGSAAYAAATLGANVDGVYRLGAGTAIGTNTLIIGSADNVLTGARSVVIGSATAAGNATVALSNTNDFTGGTTLAGGTLSLGNNHAIGDGPLTITGGALRASVAVTLNNPIFVRGDFTIGPSTSPMIVNSPVDLGGSASKITLFPTLQINGSISNGALFKSGSGTLLLATANDYAGGTTSMGGTLYLLAQGALGSGPLALSGTLRTANVPQNISNPVNLVGSARFNFEKATNLGGPISLSTAFNATLILDSAPLGGVLSGPISDASGALALSKEGAGTVALTGNNSYRGGTTFVGGAVAVASDASLGATSNPVSSLVSNLVFRGGTLRYDAAFTLNPIRAFEIQSNSSTAPTIDTNGFDVTIGNGITGGNSGTGRFIKGGAGKLTLTGSNTYLHTTLSAGTLQFNSIASMGAGTVTMAPGTVVAAGFAINQAVLNKLSKSSDAVVALAANSSNALDFTGANWRLGAIGNVSFGGTIVPNGSTYRLGGGGGTLTLTIGNILSGARNLDIAGGGTVSLVGPYNYTGTTRISGSTLKLGASAGLPATSSISLADEGIFDVRSLASGFTLGSGKSLLGSGDVLGRVVASAGSNVSPGTATAPFGDLAIDHLALRGSYLADIDALGHHDILTITGDLDLTSLTDGLTVNGTGSLLDEYVLATYSGTLTGVFNSLTLPPGTGLDYGTGTNSQIRLVPEPGAGMLVLAGVLSLFPARRRHAAGM